MIPYHPNPILFELGPIKIFTFGLVVAIGYLLALYLSARDAEKKGIEKKHIYDLGIWMLIAGLVVARLFYVIQFGGNPIAIWEGGIVYWGSFIGGVLTILGYTRYFRLPFLKVLDSIVLHVPLAHGIGRIGCWFKGCCYGLPMQNVMPWAVDYLGALRHPTQLYSVFTNLGFFGILKFLSRLKLKKRIRKVKRWIDFDGFITSSYLIIYPIIRFILEIFRDEPHIWLSFSSAQVLTFFILPLGLGLFIFLKVKSRRQGS